MILSWLLDFLLGQWFSNGGPRPPGGPRTELWGSAVLARSIGGLRTFTAEIKTPRHNKIRELLPVHFEDNRSEQSSTVLGTPVFV